ncbi:MAG: hypothetical protein IPH57_17545 [Saprospiraceae bacterium]|nr:hypothetical protein [Saprospiraceae bacterium]
MKTIKFISIFILLCGFTFALVQCTKDEATKSELKGSKIEYRTSNPCAPDLGNNPNCDSVSFDYFVSIPMYPGCQFRVQFLYWECIDGLGNIAYHLSDYQIISHDCPQYNTDLQNAMNNGTINIFNIAFGKQIWNAITVLLLNSTSPSLGAITLEYYVASCAKECYWKSRTGFWLGKRYSCGENCCIAQRNYNKINGVWILTNSKTNFPLDPCYGARPVDCPVGRDEW